MQKGGLSLSILVIATFLYAILYIMTSWPSLGLSSRLHRFKRCNIPQTIDVFRRLLVTNLAALPWALWSEFNSPLVCGPRQNKHTQAMV